MPLLPSLHAGVRAVRPKTQDRIAGERLTRLDWLLLFSLSLLLAFGPLAFGAVQAWSVFILEIGAAFCAVLWAIRQAMADEIQVYNTRLFIPVLAFAALVAVQLLLGRTVYWYATWNKALLWASYGMIFFVAMQSLRGARRVRFFALAFSAYGFLVALFAMVQQFTWNGKIFWLVPNRSGGWVYGPYVNHAHYSGLMELLAPFPLVLALASVYRKSFRVLFAFIALLMAGTIFLSRSLGGMVAFVLQIAVLAIITKSRQRSRRHILLALLIAVVFAAWLYTFSLGGIGERIARLQDPMGKSAAGDRLAIARDSLRMIGKRPVLGWGLGTFSVAYPAYRSFYTNYFVNEAHNDYLQVAVETGLAGFALACSFIVILYREAFRRIEGWRNRIRPSAALAALVGVTGILVHSLSDFNLQIPANAALFFALAALAAGEPGKTAARGSGS